MARVALHAIQPAGVNGHDRSLHIYEIVLAQSALPFARLLSATTLRLADSIFCPHLKAGLAMSVPYPVNTCNVMAHMNLPDFLKQKLEPRRGCLKISNRLFNARGKRGVIVAVQVQRGAERDADPSRPYER